MPKPGKPFAISGCLGLTCPLMSGAPSRRRTVGWCLCDEMVVAWRVMLTVSTRSRAGGRAARGLPWLLLLLLLLLSLSQALALSRPLSRSRNR